MNVTQNYKTATVLSLYGHKIRMAKILTHYMYLYVYYTSTTGKFAQSTPYHYVFCIEIARKLH